MSTPESTAEPSDRGTAARTKQDTLTQSVGTRLAVPTSEAKPSWWKRLLGRG
jgi:hypothetical protein